MDQIYRNGYFGYRLKHAYVRLHDSLDKWILSDGKVKTRMKTELTVNELNKLPAREITGRALGL